jgi:hypothetical protein
LGKLPGMTPQQQQEFNQYGCIAKCIIELARSKGHPITEADFCQQFYAQFLTPGRYGLLLISQLVEIIPALPFLGLNGQFQTYRRYCAIEYHRSHERRDVLVLSEIDLNANATRLNDHCSVLKEINHQYFKLWITPNLERDFEVNSWEAKACHGVVLFG